MDQIVRKTARIALKVDQYVGSKIRQRRGGVGLTQEQLAEALDISYQQIQKYETGANRVSAGRLYQIAQILGVDINYFFDDMPDGHFTVDPSQGGAPNRSVIELVRNFNAIEDDSIQGAILSLVRSLAGASGADQESEERKPSNGFLLDGMDARSAEAVGAED